MSSSLPFDVLTQKPGEFLVAGCGNVSVLVWYGRATPEGVELSASTAPARFEAYPEGVSVIHLITEWAELPSAAARDAFVRQAEELGARVSVVSIIIEKTGFAASALRSAVTGILMLSKGQFVRRVHGSVGEASVWFPAVHASRTGVSIDARALQRTLESIRELALESRLKAAMP